MGSGEKRERSLKCRTWSVGLLISIISSEIWAFLILAIFTTIRREFSGPFGMKYGDFRDRNLNRYLQCNVNTQSSSHRGRRAGADASYQRTTKPYLIMENPALTTAVFWILEVVGNDTRDPYWHNTGIIYAMLSAFSLSLKLHVDVAFAFLIIRTASRLGGLFSFYHCDGWYSYGIRKVATCRVEM